MYLEKNLVSQICMQGYVILSTYINGKILKKDLCSEDKSTFLFLIIKLKISKYLHMYLVLKVC